MLQRVQALAGQGALLVKGKHDEMAVRPPAESKTGGGSTTDWTHAQLGSSQPNFLDNLPLLREHGSMALVPATQLGPPAPWPYVTDQRAAAASLDALS